MNSDYTQGDYTYLDGDGSVDPTKEELQELHSARELNRARRHNDRTVHTQQANVKARNRKRNKQARKARRRNR